MSRSPAVSPRVPILFLREPEARSLLNKRGIVQNRGLSPSPSSPVEGEEGEGHPAHQLLWVPAPYQVRGRLCAGTTVVMSYVIAGVFSGLLMASVTMTVGPLMLFFMAKDPSPGFQSLLERVSPMKMVMGLLAVSYPLWTIAGGVAGLIYRVSFEAFPGGGLGSQNLVFTLAVLLFAAGVAAPIFVVLRRMPVGGGGPDRRVCRKLRLAAALPG